MKAILPAIFFVIACCGGAETNRTTMPQLNAHQQFYVNYRAHRARLQRGVSELDTAIAKEELLNKKKAEAGQGKSITNEAFNMKNRRAEITGKSPPLMPLDWNTKRSILMRPVTIMPRPLL